MQPSDQQEQPAEENTKQAREEVWVYPPPPSFYQNMPLPAELPPLPPAQGQIPPAQPAAPPPLPGYPPPFMPSPPQQPVAKRSRKWVWITVSILAVALLASCGLCGWGLYTLFAPAFQSVSGSLAVVNDYFTNLQDQNYAAAYRDLAVPGLTQAQFTRQAMQRDQAYGPILSYTVNQPSFSSNPNSGPNLSQFTFTVQVKRRSLSYTVTLTTSQVQGSWKIIYFDKI